MDEDKAIKRNRWDDGDDSSRVSNAEKRRRKEKRKAKAAAAAARETTDLDAAEAVRAEQLPNDQDMDFVLPDDMVLLESSNAPRLTPSRSVDAFKMLNLIEEGSYGIVYRAQDLSTGEIVALKKMKFDEKSPGFPVTSLREINALKTLSHPHILSCHEVVVGSTHREYV